MEKRNTAWLIAEDGARNEKKVSALLFGLEKVFRRSEDNPEMLAAEGKDEDVTLLC